MAQCESCGKEMVEGSQFCPKCGAQQAAGLAAVPPQATGPVQPPPVQGQVPPPPMPPPPGQAAYQQAPVAQPKRRKGLPRGAKIAIIIGAVVVVLIAIAVVVAVVFFVDVISGPADVANGYVRAINEGQLVTAWNYLAEQTKQEESRTDFDANMKELEGNIKTWFTSSINVGTGGRAYVKMDITSSASEKTTWYMYLVKERDTWKIRTVSTDILPGFEED